MMASPFPDRTTCRARRSGTRSTSLDHSGSGACVSIIMFGGCASLLAVLVGRILQLGPGGNMVGLRIFLANASVMVISSRRQIKSVLRAESKLKHERSPTPETAFD